MTVAATPAEAAQTPSLSRRLNASECLECGAAFERTGTPGAFCTGRCRTIWNNRRLARGAELYDLFMALRFDRKRAGVLGLYTALCRAATLFRKADQADRAGRRSWGDPEDVFSRRPYLRAKSLIKTATGGPPA